MRRFFQIGWFMLVIAGQVAPAVEPSAKAPATKVAIVEGKWHLNGAVTYPGAKAEGLLMNVRVVNAVFEDANEKTRPKGFDADTNTDKFIKQIPDYVASGVRAFTLCLQGGHCGYEDAVNSAFSADGSLRESYLKRVRRVIEACDTSGAAVILGCYYQRQDQILKDEDAVRAGLVNVVTWVKECGFTNVVLEVANEFAHAGFDHKILKNSQGEAELIALAKKTAPELLVSTSGMGTGLLPDEVAKAADFLLIHFNTTKLEDAPARIAALKKYGKPIVCNEDDKVGVEGVKAAELCVAGGASWGFMHTAVNQYFPKLTFNGVADDPLVYATLKRLTTANRRLGSVPIGKGGADGVVAVGKDGVIHVVYGGKYRYGAAADSLSPAESITELQPVRTVRMAIDAVGQPHVVFTTGATDQAKCSYYTVRIKGRWLPAEKFADAADFAERTRAYVADVATDGQGQVLVSFWVSRSKEKRPQYDDPSFYYRWRSPGGQWGPPLSLPAHWSSAPKVEYEPGRGFFLLWQLRGTQWRIAGPIAAGEKFTEALSVSTGSETLTGVSTIQNEGADFSRSAGGSFVVVGNVREKFEGPVGVWAALGQGDAVSSTTFLGSFPGTKRGDESSVHPVPVIDAATGAAFITVMNPGDKRACYTVHQRGSGWQLPYTPILPDHRAPQGNTRQGPSVADVPGPGVIALARDGAEQWHLCPLLPPVLRPLPAATP